MLFLHVQVQIMLLLCKIRSGPLKEEIKGIIDGQIVREISRRIEYE